MGGRQPNCFLVEMFLQRKADAMFEGPFGLVVGLVWMVWFWSLCWVVWLFRVDLVAGWVGCLALVSLLGGLVVWCWSCCWVGWLFGFGLVG